MGSVAMGSGGSWVFEGYNITETAYSLYCDKCGSFDIMCWIPFPKWLGVLISGVALVAGLYYLWAPCWVIPGSLLLLIIFTSDSVRHSIHICNKCGNSQISRGNVLNYKEYDRDILDVPYEATIRYYVEDG